MSNSSLVRNRPSGDKNKVSRHILTVLFPSKSKLTIATALDWLVFNYVETGMLV